jgi:hypothetical protein
LITANTRIRTPTTSVIVLSGTGSSGSFTANSLSASQAMNASTSRPSTTPQNPCHALCPTEPRPAGRSTDCQLRKESSRSRIAETAATCIPRDNERTSGIEILSVEEAPRTFSIECCLPASRRQVPPRK